MAPAEPVAVVLAAGLSKRFGKANKLLSLVDGEPVIHRLVRSVIEAGFPVLVVTGHEADEVERSLESLPGVRFVRNDRFVEGMGSSIACGVAASPNASGWLIVPGDMPRLTPATLRKVASNQQPKDIAACRVGKISLPPCFFGRSYFDALVALTGDHGAKRILMSNVALVRLIDANPGELEDADLGHEPSLQESET